MPDRTFWSACAWALVFIALGSVAAAIVGVA